MLVTGGLLLGSAVHITIEFLDCGTSGLTCMKSPPRQIYAAEGNLYLDLGCIRQTHLNADG